MKPTGENNVVSGLKPMPHYYGDGVRKLFIAGAVVMLVTLPSLQSLISLPVMVSLFVILIIGIAAGLTNPRHVWAAFLNAIIAGGGACCF